MERWDVWDVAGYGDTSLRRGATTDGSGAAPPSSSRLGITYAYVPTRPLSSGGVAGTPAFTQRALGPTAVAVAMGVSGAGSRGGGGTTPGSSSSSSRRLLRGPASLVGSGRGGGGSSRAGGAAAQRAPPLAASTPAGRSAAQAALSATRARALAAAATRGGRSGGGEGEVDDDGVGTDDGDDGGLLVAQLVASMRPSAATLRLSSAGAAANPAAAALPTVPAARQRVSSTPLRAPTPTPLSDGRARGSGRRLSLGSIASAGTGGAGGGGGIAVGTANPAAAAATGIRGFLAAYMPRAGGESGADAALLPTAEPAGSAAPAAGAPHSTVAATPQPQVKPADALPSPTAGVTRRRAAASSPPRATARDSIAPPSSPAADAAVLDGNPWGTLYSDEEAVVDATQASAGAVAAAAAVAAAVSASETARLSSSAVSAATAEDAVWPAAAAVAATLATGRPPLPRAPAAAATPASAPASQARPPVHRVSASLARPSFAGGGGHYPSLRHVSPAAGASADAESMPVPRSGAGPVLDAPPSARPLPTPPTSASPAPRPRPGQPLNTPRQQQQLGLSAPGSARDGRSPARSPSASLAMLAGGGNDSGEAPSLHRTVVRAPPQAHQPPQALLLSESLLRTGAGPVSGDSSASGGSGTSLLKSLTAQARARALRTPGRDGGSGGEPSGMLSLDDIGDMNWLLLLSGNGGLGDAGGATASEEPASHGTSPQRARAQQAQPTSAPAPPSHSSAALTATAEEVDGDWLAGSPPPVLPPASGGAAAAASLSLSRPDLGAGAPPQLPNSALSPRALLPVRSRLPAPPTSPPAFSPLHSPRSTRARAAPSGELSPGPFAPMSPPPAGMLGGLAWEEPLSLASPPPPPPPPAAGTGTGAGTLADAWQRRSPAARHASGASPLRRHRDALSGAPAAGTPPLPASTLISSFLAEASSEAVPAGAIAAVYGGELRDPRAQSHAPPASTALSAAEASELLPAVDGGDVAARASPLEATADAPAAAAAAATSPVAVDDASLLAPPPLPPAAPPAASEHVAVVRRRPPPPPSAAASHDAQFAHDDAAVRAPSSTPDRISPDSLADGADSRWHARALPTSPPSSVPLPALSPSSPPRALPFGPAAIRSYAGICEAGCEPDDDDTPVEDADEGGGVGGGGGVAGAGGFPRPAPTTPGGPPRLLPKLNQDAVVLEEHGPSDALMLAVFDGHGVHGGAVAAWFRDRLPAAVWAHAVFSAEREPHAASAGASATDNIPPPPPPPPQTSHALAVASGDDATHPLQPPSHPWAMPFPRFAAAALMREMRGEAAGGAGSGGVGSPEAVTSSALVLSPPPPPSPARYSGTVPGLRTSLAPPLPLLPATARRPTPPRRDVAAALCECLAALESELLAAAARGELPLRAGGTVDDADAVDEAEGGVRQLDLGSPGGSSGGTASGDSPRAGRDGTAAVDLSMSGCTACVLVAVGGHVTVANIGDSRAVLVRRGGGRGDDGGSGGGGGGGGGPLVAWPLTVDHKPSLPPETRRILLAGGRLQAIRYDDGAEGPLRVWLRDADVPGLAMSRSLGDTLVKAPPQGGATASGVRPGSAGGGCGVISTPDVYTYTLTPSDAFIVLASDGLWEFTAPGEVAAVLEATAEAAAAEAAAAAARGDGTADADAADGGPPSHLALALDALAELAGARWRAREGAQDDLSILVAEVGPVGEGEGEAMATR